MAGIWSGDFRMHGGIAHRNSPAGLSRPTAEGRKWRCGASWRRAVRPSIAWVARIELPQQRRAGARPAKVGGDLRDRGIADHALWLAPRRKHLRAGLARAAGNSASGQVDWRLPTCQFRITTSIRSLQSFSRAIRLAYASSPANPRPSGAW